MKIIIKIDVIHNIVGITKVSKFLSGLIDKGKIVTIRKKNSIGIKIPDGFLKYIFISLLIRSNIKIFHI